MGLALSQHVTGLGITLLATAPAYYAYRVSFPKVNTPPTVMPFAPWTGCPSPSSRPDRADAAGAAAGAVIGLVPLPHAGRPGGAHGGREPAGGGGPGHQGGATRTGAIVAGSALMGVAGSFLTLSAFNAFYFNMVNGRGWICVALVVFASWRPGKALLGALLFAFFDALQLRLQQASGRAALSGVPDAAVSAVDPGAGAGGAEGGLSAGADEALSQGRALEASRACRRLLQYAAARQR